MGDEVAPGKFQSPDGDFVYSDLGILTSNYSESMSFNPLTGISSILTKEGGDLMRAWKIVSIP